MCELYVLHFSEYHVTVAKLYIDPSKYFLKALLASINNVEFIAI